MIREDLIRYVVRFPLNQANDYGSVITRQLIDKVNKKLQDGGLFLGELGKPNMTGLSSEERARRLSFCDMYNTCNELVRVMIDENKQEACFILKLTGPKKQIATEILKLSNSRFALRAFGSTIYDENQCSTNKISISEVICFDLVSD